MKNIIEVKNLKKSYGNITAVDDISFRVKEGELFAFLGINGAGKSTTINIISGVLRKNSGSVLVDNLDTDKDAQKIKGRLGIVFQESLLDNKLSVLDNLKIKATMYGVSNADFRKKLEELDSLLELKPLLSRPLEKLSGGQRRRIDIARALIHSPRVLILDEPTTGLDPITRTMVWKCFNELRKRDNMTIFLTTHYMEEAADADFVVILDGGKIVADDTPNGLKNTYAADFIRLFNPTEAAYKMIEKEKLEFKDKDTFMEIQVDKVSTAKKLMLSYPDAFEDFEIIKGKMDDVFLRVTGKALGGDDNE